MSSAPGSTSLAATPTHHPWWKDVVCYQIWPRSFKDTNRDGIGDIQGIISRLSYLKELGIDVIWVSPTYNSPMVDFGYDISEWQSVGADFGTMEDMDELIEQVHKKGMKILLDLVVTHTSNQHAWFKESKASKENAKSDWYIWKDARKEHKIFNHVTETYDEIDEPTNWRACFGGSAWTYAPERDQYYLHLFMPSEPDLNFEKEYVRKAVYEEAIGFWLDKGIDGFRIDTVNRISKDWSWPDAEVKLEDKIQPASKYYINGPRSYEFLKEMREYMENHPRVKERGESLMLVGELPLTAYDDVLGYVHPDSKELSMVFDFDMVKLGGHDDPDNVKAHQVKHLCDGDPSFTLPLFKQRLQKVQNLIAEGAWGTVFMENHDQCRCVERYTTPIKEYYIRAAKLLCLLQTTLSGTQFVYQGQEIAMTNMPEHWGCDDFRDPGAKDYINREWQVATAEYGKEAGLKAREIARRGNLKLGRDNGRTPVQWTGGKHAGFSDTDGECWMGVNENCREGFNIEDQRNDESSTWNFWKKHIQMRNISRGIFMHGKFEVMDEGNENSFTYLKTAANGETAMVVLNFSEAKEEVKIPDDVLKCRVLSYLTGNICDPENCYKPLEAWEGRVYVFEGL